jgi:hypothetical protein
MSPLKYHAIMVVVMLAGGWRNIRRSNKKTLR